MDKKIGVVKWFYNEHKKANYGFIQHAILGDLFFHEKSLESGQDIGLFKEGEAVVFISQESKKYSGKLEAINVMLLSNEKNINFLFDYILEVVRSNVSIFNYSNVQKVTYQRLKELLDIKVNKGESNRLYALYENEIIKNIKSPLNSDINFLKNIFEFIRCIFPDNIKEMLTVIEGSIDAEKKFELWIAGYIDNIEIEYIVKNIFNFNWAIKRDIFNRITSKCKYNIFEKIVCSIKGENSFNIEIIKNFIHISKQYSSEKHQENIKEILEICPVYYKLVLWLEGYHDELNFDEYKVFTVTLNPDEQKKFVKKILKYIHEGKSNISVEELTSINVIDYENSKFFEKNNSYKLDYSTSIILNTVLELNNQNKIETRQHRRNATFKIFDLILNQIKEPDEILEIKGYFDECAGRCTVHIEADKPPQYIRSKYKKPKLHPICDGRKFLKYSLPVLCDTKKVEFWWCANQKCYSPSSIEHSSDEWEKYTLLDFLKILKINFIESDYEIYLNIMNKANRFLKHLKCRECEHILRPARKSNYAFYGVNNFKCTNEACKEKDKEIYLTHCLNGRCEQEIDSRDSVKCIPQSVDKKYGWYVCNYCHSCCSNYSLEARKSNMNSRGQEYFGQIEGHQDLGVISCNKCGNSMGTKNADIEGFNNVLRWFVENKDKSPYIKKSGKTINNKNWFMFARHDQQQEEYNSKLKYYLSLGFQIPNIDENRSFQLISEPNNYENHNSGILSCNFCSNILDLANDTEQASAIRYFYKAYFDKLV